MAILTLFSLRQDNTRVIKLFKNINEHLLDSRRSFNQCLRKKKLFKFCIIAILNKLNNLQLGSKSGDSREGERTEAFTNCNPLVLKS